MRLPDLRLPRLRLPGLAPPRRHGFAAPRRRSSTVGISPSPRAARISPSAYHGGVGLVRTWTRQVARAAGASLIAPLVLMLAAAVVASAGGLGGIGSLGQVTSGPPLPDTGLDTASRSSLEGVEIVGAEAPESVETPPPAPPSGALASASTASGAVPAATRAQPAAAPATETVPPPTKPPTTTTPSLTDSRGFSPDTPPGGSRRPPGGNPIARLEEVTRGLGDALPAPLGPITNNLIDLLLGPPPPPPR